MEEEPELSKEDKIKESIRVDLELMRLSFLSIMAIGGGLVTLVTTNDWYAANNIFIAFGLIFLAIAIHQSRRRYNKIKKRL